MTGSSPNVIDSTVKCSQLKSSNVNSLFAILCIVEQELATVPTLYVSYSFHQYSGAVMSTVTLIIRRNLAWSLPALESDFMSLRSFSPIMYPHSYLSQVGHVCEGTNPHPLSLLFQLFIGFLMPRIVASQPNTPVFSSLSI